LNQDSEGEWWSSVGFEFVEGANPTPTAITGGFTGNKYTSATA